MNSSQPELNFNISGNNNQQAGGNIYNTFNSPLPVPVPSYLSIIIQELEKKLDVVPIASNRLPYSIEAKIMHNRVIKYRKSIEDFSCYGYIIDNIYDIMNSIKPNSVRRFNSSISLLYSLILGDFCKELEKTKEQIILEKSDDILEQAICKLTERYLKNNATNVIPIEDINQCITLIICKAFIDCKILEHPNI